MPKKATDADQIDPVRSRLRTGQAEPDPIRSSLAAEVAAPVARREVVGERSQDAGPGAFRESGGGAAVIEHAATPPTRRPSHARSQPQKLVVNRKFLVTQGEHDRIDDLLGVISQKFGKTAYSHVSRAMWTILAMAEEAIEAAPARERMKAPAKGDYIGMAEFEEALADFLLKAIKRS